MAPIPWFWPAAELMPESTWKSAKKNGIWISMGRQAENGLVPCFLYSAICSCAMAWRDSWSVLPLYWSWSFFRSGCSSRIRRWALTCFINTGIRAARMTSTSPMMDRVQVQPPAPGIPMALSPSWNPTMIAETSHLNGAKIDPTRSTVIPIRQMQQSYGETERLSRLAGSGHRRKCPQPAGRDREPERPPESQGFRGSCL